jgi:hypothetical protein
MIIGFVSRDFFIGAGSSYFGNSVASSAPNILMEMETLPVLIKNLPFIGSSAGALGAVVLLVRSN